MFSECGCVERFEESPLTTHLPGPALLTTVRFSAGRSGERRSESLCAGNTSG